MKNCHFRAFAPLNPLLAGVALLVVSSLAALALPPLAGDSLNVGPSTGSAVNTVGPGFSGAIGEVNSVLNSPYCLAIGLNNTINGYAMDFALGDSHLVGGVYNLTLGSGNEVDGTANLVVGGTITVDVFTEATGVFGVVHQLVMSAECLVSGNNNVVSGSVDSAAFGHGLILTNATSRVVIGQYNLGNETNALFVIGNGTAATPQGQSNAFTVSNNGDVRVSGVIRVTAPAGDIPMFVAP